LVMPMALMASLRWPSDSNFFTAPSMQF
jgi:hypothetical protein